MRIKPGTFIRVFAYEGDYEPRKINLSQCIEFTHEYLNAENQAKKWHGYDETFVSDFCNPRFRGQDEKGPFMEVVEFMAILPNGEEVRGDVDVYDLKEILEDSE